MFLSPILHAFQKGKFYFLPPCLETFTYTPVATCAGVSTTSWLACGSVTLWRAQMKRQSWKTCLPVPGQLQQHRGERSQNPDPRYIHFQFQSIRDAFQFYGNQIILECQTYSYITKLINTWVWGFRVCLSAFQHGRCLLSWGITLKWEA